MTLLSQRLQHHLNQLNQSRTGKERLTSYRIALEVGLDPTYVANIFGGRKRGSAKALEKLAKSELLGLEYETLRGWQAQEQFEPEALREAFRGSGLEMMAPEGFERIPCRGSVTAGGLRFDRQADDWTYYEWWDLPDVPAEDKANFFCLRVEGDSMWPPVPDGSFILVREVNPDRLAHGAWYVVLNTVGETTFKMVEFDRERMLLTPLNPAHSAIQVEGFAIEKAYEVLKYQVNRLRPVESPLTVASTETACGIDTDGAE